MRTSRFADEQQVQAVRQVDAGTPALEAGQPDVLGGGEMRLEGEGALALWRRLAYLFERDARRFVSPAA